MKIMTIDNSAVKPVTVRLNWYGKHTYLSLGDSWAFAVKLKLIHGYANPGSFDYERYMLQQNIIAKGYIVKSVHNHLIKGGAKGSTIGRLRQDIVRNISLAVPDSPFRGMIKALVVGDKSEITPSQWTVFQNTGTNHLVVIAGLHIGMICGLGFILIRFIWSCFEYLALRYPATKVAAVSAIIIAFIYSALAGFSIPTERATVMIVVFMSAILLQRQLSLGVGLSLALLAVLIIHPLATLNFGFWLSFAAVSVIFYGMSARISANNLWWRLGRIQFVVSLGLIPFTLLLFQNASFISPVANSIAIPLVGFIVVPLSLLASAISFYSIHAAGVLFQVALFVLSLVWDVLSWLSAHKYMAVQFAVYSPINLFFAVLAVLLLLAPRGVPAKFLCIVLILPLIFNKPRLPEVNTVEFTLLDVGQGLAAIVQTKHHSLVYDTGAKFSDQYDMGKAVLIPFLRIKGITHLDKVIISHADNDHSGGFDSLRMAFPITTSYTSDPRQAKQLHLSLCLQGQHWRWDGVNFDILYPSANRLGLGNESSCVLRISTGKQSLLLVGDIENKAENELLMNNAKMLPAQILVVPHHGSKTSSSNAFINAVMPKYALFPVGYLNRYRLPNQSVVSRYQKIGAKIYRTDSSGAIFILLSPNTAIKPISYRKQYQRIWRQ